MLQQKNKLAPLLMLSRPFKASDARTHGLTSSHLAYYCNKGMLQRLSRGVYAAAHARSGAHDALEQLVLKKTQFVLCLFSALQIHELTTQSPTALWIAIAQGARMPQLDGYHSECVRLTPAPFHYGIEEHIIDGMTVKVYSAAKTVADCFKFRNKIGIDVAIEALRDGYRQQRFSISELMEAARVNRVANIITPYVESLIS